MCLGSSVPEDYEDRVRDYSKQGFRLIAVAGRQLDISWTEVSKREREREREREKKRKREKDRKKEKGREREKERNKQRNKDGGLS